MTCITIVRLGQINNKNRPRNELKSALKGRIAYLPVDVSATARFLPKNLLNIDSLILLVGRQPTQKKTIWTSLVDMRKVHSALDWLRQNNTLYKDVPAYTKEQLENIIAEKINATDNTTPPPENSILKKMTATRSHIYTKMSLYSL